MVAVNGSHIDANDDDDVGARVARDSRVGDTARVTNAN